MSPPEIKKSTVGFTSAIAPDAAREIGTRPIDDVRPGVPEAGGDLSLEARPLLRRSPGGGRAS